MQLADLMSTDVLTVAPDQSVAEAARSMIARETGVAVVLEDGALAGVISERDLLRVISDAADTETPVAERMTRHVQTASATTSIPEALAMMIDGRFRHLPIVDAGRVVGVVSMRDLMAWTAFRLRHGPLESDDDEIDSAELVATIHRMRTGAA